MSNFLYAAARVCRASIALHCVPRSAPFSALSVLLSLGIHLGCLPLSRRHRRYDDNGGTVVAVAGDDYCVVAASTRMSTGYSILTRNKSKILQL